MSKLERMVKQQVKQFEDEYLEFLNENLIQFNTTLGKSNFLIGQAFVNRSEWSGGFSLTNYEESIKRDIALSLLRELIQTNYMIEQVRTAR